jgi:hypothetical protein
MQRRPVGHESLLLIRALSRPPDVSGGRLFGVTAGSRWRTDGMRSIEVVFDHSLLLTIAVVGG